MVGRIPITNVMPLVDLGRQSAKATVGEPFPVTATVFREGHDRLGAEVVLTDPTAVSDCKAGSDRGTIVHAAELQVFGKVVKKKR